MPFAWSVRAFGPLNAPCAHLAVDRQMTPPSHAVLFGPSALTLRLASDRLSGTPSAALRPKASRTPDCVKELRAKVNQNKRPEFCTNSGLSDARRQAASLSPSAACRQAGAASHGGDEAAFAKGAGKYFKVKAA